MTGPVARRSFLAGVAATLASPAVLRSTAFAATTGASPPAHVAPDVLTGWIRTVYPLVRADRILPPAAARVYAHVALAGYEAMVGSMPHHRSLGGVLNGLAPMPVGAGVDVRIAANEAMAAAAQAMFADRSAESRAAVEAARADRSAAYAVGVAPGVLTRSVAHGRRIGAAVAARADADGYLETRGLAYEPPVGPGLWVRTPPNFGAAIEPHWSRVRSFTLVANDECRPARPVPYSEEVGSPFWQQADTVYRTGLGLDDEQRLTALFWRDNPDGSTGLPSGHWMLTACTAIETVGLAADRAAEVLVLTGLALADGFTSCWTEKYDSNLLRPVTYIKAVIDPSWNSFVNSPAFPEYTSGHSVGSGAAAHVLTSLLGDVTYVDDVGLLNGYPVRTFTSFDQAAQEAATSRLFGGIHYPMAIEVGLEQGRAVAEKVLARALTRR